MRTPSQPFMGCSLRRLPHIDRKSPRSHRIHHSPWSVVPAGNYGWKLKYEPPWFEILSVELLTPGLALLLSQESRWKISFIDLQQVTPHLFQIYKERISPTGVTADLQ